MHEQGNLLFHFSNQTTSRCKSSRCATTQVSSLSLNPPSLPPSIPPPLASFAPSLTLGRGCETQGRSARHLSLSSSCLPSNDHLTNLPRSEQLGDSADLVRFLFFCCCCCCCRRVVVFNEVKSPIIPAGCNGGRIPGRVLNASIPGVVRSFGDSRSLQLFLTDTT